MAVVKASDVTANLVAVEGLEGAPGPDADVIEKSGRPVHPQKTMAEDGVLAAEQLQTLRTAVDLMLLLVMVFMRRYW